MNTPMLSQFQRIVLITLSVIILFLVSPPENYTQAGLFTLVLVSVSYDAWWSGIESVNSEDDSA